ncbi:MULTISPECIES: hypothetical protein [Anaerococcus]|uniref:Uncharacterized protein n=1 Tax=Anaerococcus kampingae TaxID=3115614 RepID=A0ABW9MBR2_9FIRM|nr:hypothetical protein [Anaerococcus sp. Marseille-P3915]
MERIKDFFHTTKIAFRETIKKLGKSYFVLIFVMVSTIFDNNEFGFGPVGSTIGGIIHYFIGVIITSFILQSLISVVKYGNTGKKSLENSMGNYFMPLIETMFWMYILDVVASLLLVNFPVRVNIIVRIIIQILTSALYEEIYLNNRYGIDAIRESIVFVKNNILNYGIFSLLFIALEFILSIYLGLGQAMSTNKIFACLIISLVHSFFMLFRGHLFKYLNEHPYRQRKFMRGFDD